jgi:hypothetical protein
MSGKFSLEVYVRIKRWRGGRRETSATHTGSSAGKKELRKEGLTTRIAGRRNQLGTIAAMKLVGDDDITDLALISTVGPLNQRISIEEKYGATCLAIQDPAKVFIPGIAVLVGFQTFPINGCGRRVLMPA